ncbi:hypothetical protein B7P43_G02956 [Cryptotermes secundus]|uniref:Mos1 transposase HTH domain-containing protein n=1 Tax=Cryptotermes secundus TaxID=105785 RepID=A0A2J7PM84_9NEOP|nr:hypothetical protein B7P43_G02956 [Cryptotermes secundus]
MGASSVRRWVKHFKDGTCFLLCIVRGDESWFHHFEPETKRQSMEWHHLHSPSKKKAKTVPSAAKVMGTVFWDAYCPHYPKHSNDSSLKDLQKQHLLMT